MGSKYILSSGWISYVWANNSLFDNTTFALIFVGEWTSVSSNLFAAPSLYFERQIVAQDSKNDLASKSDSNLAASSAHSNPPRSAIFSETVNFPLTFPNSVSLPSNNSIAFFVLNSNSLRSESVHQLFSDPFSSNWAPLLSNPCEISRYNSADPAVVSRWNSI
nr:hypothetical protein [Mycoplasmopsis cynos]